MLLEGQLSFLPVDVAADLLPCVPSLDSVCLFQSGQNSVKSTSPLSTVTQSRGGLTLVPKLREAYPFALQGVWAGLPLPCGVTADGGPKPHLPLQGASPALALSTPPPCLSSRRKSALCCWPRIFWVTRSAS